ncbi:exosome complex component RRP45A-like isoform X2 [Rhododendron vialii]|uniref:exosome complex component RRP45A-like isoform X2 n=1 Tax=Rhododendron vialii TaxID=182163 RepID=UPI0026600BFE|nr:exosome complex component RRP45A-like isoform X2 [Rhododendron vialii]
MEQRLANTWKMTVNEKKFIETALVADIRVDGRRPFDYRRLTIKFGREDGSSEVQLGQTHVMGFVTSELVQPYRDRQNEGTLSIFTEFSPMADPSFEAGRAGESAVELARIIDRGLRESRAVDMESLCVIAGKLVWAIRVDLHILDNGGNLVDAANIAALAALSTFRRPEFTLGGEGGQEVIIHPPEVIDPTHKEESVMGGRMIATLNTNGDICAIQKAGRVAIMHTVIMQCLRIASVKAGDITSKIKNAVESYNTERALRKIKRHSSAALDVHKPVADWETQNQSVDQKRMSDLPGHQERLKPISKESGVSQSNNMEEVLTPNKPPEESTDEKPSETESDQLNADIMPAHSPDGAVGTVVETNRKNTLADAVKPKHKRKKKSSSNIDAS